MKVEGVLPEELAEEAMEALRAKAKDLNLAEPVITKTILDSSENCPSGKITTSYPH